MNRRPTVFRSLLCLVLGSGSLLHAQTNARPSTAGKPDDTVELSPFTVNTDQDTGYIATDSLVGGRLSTELLKTPSDVTVLTRDFLNDIGATDYIAASAY